MMTTKQRQKRAVMAIMRAAGVDPKGEWPYLPRFYKEEFGELTNQERWLDLLATHGFHITLSEMANEYGDNRR